MDKFIDKICKIIILKKKPRDFFFDQIQNLLDAVHGTDSRLLDFRFEAKFGGTVIRWYYVDWYNGETGPIHTTTIEEL